MGGGAVIAAMRGQELRMVKSILAAGTSFHNSVASIGDLQLGTPVCERSGKIMSFALGLQGWQQNVERGAFEDWEV